MERRKFLMLFGVGTVASYLPVAIAACSSLLKPDAASAQSNFLVVGTVADLDNAGQILKDTEIGTIAVVRSPDNPQNLAAVDPTCTHNGCTTSWDSSSQSYNCPCHGAKFDAYGNGISGPSRKPLRTYDATIQGNSVLVRRS
ncbi:QcrA and Rieske domain-containing protein [Pseudanabaena yagii]|uniref:Rieske 2Fe-2S domain-containing protein n=1 Tax=Pseudanabaena yagii GIHE-NHR1 TaxID=2722753 RepID=A0ABX1M0L9_9CYAN|nr:Rieske 2Fe-2S domain-containing protein [Pseudanabaena yagii]NMF60746.1 Rieske 2Fe-2S domain-containing protein [Pseudanabaena yagii GIHE-NHR1]